MIVIVLHSLPGGLGRLQTQGNGREEHAQPLPEKHVRPHRGDKEPESLYEPVSAESIAVLTMLTMLTCAGTVRGAGWRHTPGWRWSSASSGPRRARAGDAWSRGGGGQTEPCYRIPMSPQMEAILIWCQCRTREYEVSSSINNVRVKND